MTDGKKYIFQSSINNPSNYTPRYKMFASNEEMLGNLIISIFDTPPQIKPPQKHSVETFNNGIIDVDEFNDTKEEYEKKIEKMKKYCQKYGQDISEIKLPTYEDMCTLCGRNVDLETITSFLQPKKSLDEEIGLGNIKYRIEEKSTFKEVRKYENGNIVTIHYNDGKHCEQISIENDNKKIFKYFNWITGAITNQKIIDNKKQTNTITDYYHNGNVQSVRIRDLETQEIIEQNDYDKHGNRILNDNQKLAHELIKDLTNKNFLGLQSVRNSLQDNLNKITPENIEQVLREYKQATGKSLTQSIEYARGSIDSLYENFSMQSYTTTDKLKDKISEMLVKIYPQTKKIKDMQDFLENTGIGNEFNAMLNDKSFSYSDFEYNWKELTGRDSFEDDFLNSNLPPEIKAQYNRAIWHEACTRLKIKPNLKIENSQIKNEYYKSDMIYDVQYNITEFGGDITIHNKTTGITRIIDINKLTKNMSEINFCEFLTNIQKQPAEVLEDAAIEFDKLYGFSGNEGELERIHAGGFYIHWTEETVINTKMGIHVHELGHAIDFNYLLEQCKNSSAFGSFYAAYIKERDEYVKKGNVCATGTESSINPKDGFDNYCTTNEKEMFAECYTLLMTGNCHSKETILKHFKKTLREAEKLLKEIRKLPEDVRLRKQIVSK